jgi:NAD+ synthase (glutamine-hydrolysing)
VTLKIALAQVNLTVGDIQNNTAKIIDSAQYARDQLQADLVVFPELSVTAYPPEDLLFRADFIDAAGKAVMEIAKAVDGIDIVLGYPEQDGQHLYNSAVVLRDGGILTTYRKKELPNFGVFDERRYFTSVDKLCLFEAKDTTVGITICEDIWQKNIGIRNKEAGAELILTLNASPFNAGKIHEREGIVCSQARDAGITLVYVNQIGGQDELVFDGASFVVNQQGEVVFRAAEFEEQISVLEFNDNEPLKSDCAPLYNEISSEYKALVLGILKT